MSLSNFVLNLAEDLTGPLSSFEARRQQFASDFQEMPPLFQRAMLAAQPRISPAEMDLAMLLGMGLNNVDTYRPSTTPPPSF